MVEESGSPSAWPGITEKDSKRPETTHSPGPGSGDQLPFSQVHPLSFHNLPKLHHPKTKYSKHDLAGECSDSNNSKNPTSAWAIHKGCDLPLETNASLNIFGDLILFLRGPGLIHRAKVFGFRFLSQLTKYMY